MLTDEQIKSLDAFTTAYVTAMFFTESGDTESEIPKNLGAADFSQELYDRVVTDCREFQEKFGELLIDDNCKYDGCPTIEYAGHDFWLTRNGHGAGFLDGDWDKSVAEKLAEGAKTFGELYIYVGDDSLIYPS